MHNSLGKVLLVDDEEINTFLVYFIIEEAGVAENIVTVNNGDEALELIMKQSFDTVLLDINMPVTSGFDVLDALRKHQETKGVTSPSVVILSSSVSSMDVNKALSYPMVKGYITKPFSTEHATYLVKLATQAST